MSCLRLYLILNMHVACGASCFLSRSSRFSLNSQRSSRLLFPSLRFSRRSHNVLPLSRIRLPFFRSVAMFTTRDLLLGRRTSHDRATGPTTIICALNSRQVSECHARRATSRQVNKRVYTRKSTSVSFTWKSTLGSEQ